MRKLFSLFTIGCLLIASQMLSAEAATDQLANIVSQNIEPYMSENQIPGVAVGIYYEGKEHFYNFGRINNYSDTKVTENTIFGIGSISKVFTTTLLAICVERNKCQLQDSITKYLPSLVNTHDLPINEVTLQDLATHTSSFPRDAGEFGISPNLSSNPDEVLMEALRIWKPDHPIGTHFLYSNIGIGLLGEAMGSTLGSNFKLALKTDITDPLEMSSTGLTISDSQRYRFAQGYDETGKPLTFSFSKNWPGSGYLVSTTHDQLQFLIANLGIKVGYASSQLLSAMQLAQQGHYEVNSDLVQALGWQRKTIEGELLANKNGAVFGFSTYAALLPTQKIAIIVLANKTGKNPSFPANDILSEMLKLSS